MAGRCCSPAALERIADGARRPLGARRRSTSRSRSTTRAKDQTYNTPAIATLWLLAAPGRVAARRRAAWRGPRRARADSSGRLYAWAEASSLRDPVRRRPGAAQPGRRARSTSTTRSTPPRSPRSLRANGIVDTEPYRALGRNQLRIGMYPAVDPDDVEALTPASTTSSSGSDTVRRPARRVLPRIRRVPHLSSAHASAALRPVAEDAAHLVVETVDGGEQFALPVDPALRGRRARRPTRRPRRPVAAPRPRRRPPHRARRPRRPSSARARSRSASGPASRRRSSPSPSASRSSGSCASPARSSRSGSASPTRPAAPAPGAPCPTAPRARSSSSARPSTSASPPTASPPPTSRWDAHRRDDGDWVVPRAVARRRGDRHSAEWVFHARPRS